VKEIRNLYFPVNINPTIVLQWKNIKGNTTQQINQVTSSRMCDDMEPPSPDEILSNGWIIGFRGVQDGVSKQHPTLNLRTNTNSSTTACKSAK
jgi:hypothetical protein